MVSNAIVGLLEEIHRMLQNANFNFLYINFEQDLKNLNLNNWNYKVSQSRFIMVVYAEYFRVSRKFVFPGLPGAEAKHLRPGFMHI